MSSKAARAVTFDLERVKQKRRAEIDSVIAEFGGDADAPAALASMAETLLHYRHVLRQLLDAGEMIREGKPFIVMGPGPGRIGNRTRRTVTSRGNLSRGGFMV
jgi:acetoin utilization deacetylase AcuC-like enzyme